MLFFKLTTSQKLIFSLVAGVALFASCSGPKKLQSLTTPKVPLKRSQKMSMAGRINPTEIAPEPIEKPDDDSEKKGKSSDKAEKVISTARTFIGTPYKYGGMTRSGMDCSGLLINSFTAVKVNLPRVRKSKQGWHCN